MNLEANIDNNQQEVLSLPIIFHYTSPNGFKSILENSNLWFTDSRFLNDIEEQYHIKYIIKNILDDYRNMYQKDIIEILDLYTDDENLKKLFYDNKRYIFSCSSVADELSVWSYYIKQNNCRGYSIGLNPQKLYKEFEMINEDNFEVYKCIYEQEAKRSYLLKELNFAEKALEAKAFKNNPKYAVLNILKQIIFRLSIIFKNEKFKNEREIRFIYTPNSLKTNNVKYRMNNGILIPYIEIKFNKKNTIQNILIGPGKQEQFIIEGTKEFLSSLDCKNIDILDSSIPIRTNWNI